MVPRNKNKVNSIRGKIRRKVFNWIIRNKPIIFFGLFDGKSA